MLRVELIQITGQSDRGDFVINLVVHCCYFPLTWSLPVLSLRTTLEDKNKDKYLRSEDTKEDKTRDTRTRTITRTRISTS